MTNSINSITSITEQDTGFEAITAEATDRIGVITINRPETKIFVLPVSQFPHFTEERNIHR